MYLKLTKSFLSIFVLFILAFAIFTLFAENYYNGRSPLALGADTLTYLETAQSLNIDILDASLIGVSFNFFGPVLLFQLTNFNYLILFLINIALFFISYRSIVSNFDLNTNFLSLLIWLNPMILFSLIVVNKEILAFTSMSFFIAYCHKKKILFLFIAFLLAFLTRWQMVAFIFTCMLTISKLNPLRKHRLGSLLLIVFSASLFYRIQSDVLYEGFERTSETIDFQADRWFGIIPIFNNLQSKGFYFLVVIPKVLFNLFGNPVAFIKIPSLVNPSNYSFFYNDFVISLHQLAITVVIIWAYRRKLLKLASDCIFFSIIYLIIFSLSPIVNTRYIFPIYVLLIIEIAQSYKLKKVE